MPLVSRLVISVDAVRIAAISSQFFRKRWMLHVSREMLHAYQVVSLHELSNGTCEQINVLLAIWQA